MSSFFAAIEEHRVTEDGHPVAPESFALTRHMLCSCADFFWPQSYNLIKGMIDISVLLHEQAMQKPISGVPVNEGP